MPSTSSLSPSTSTSASTSASTSSSTSTSPSLKSITFYLDFISPFAWLALLRLPEALRGISYSVEYRPVVFGAMLKHHGQLGPAEIDPKRDWTYRQVLWLADSLGVPLHMPSEHPFNPLPLLRMAVAAAPAHAPGAPSRWVCETVFRHVWEGGGDALNADRLQALESALEPQRALRGDGPHNEPEAIKVDLKANTDQAMAQGVFGVPSFMVDGKLFWGLDALPMLRAYLLGEPWFAGDAWNSVGSVRVGVARRTRSVL
jgi:2-hydroxychromene-2-carboxylate isomerase